MFFSLAGVLAGVFRSSLANFPLRGDFLASATWITTFQIADYRLHRENF
jgi:hypothetical protein